MTFPRNEKTYHHCGQTHLLARFGRDRRTTDGFHRTCRPCRNGNRRSPRGSRGSAPVMTAGRIRALMAATPPELRAALVYVLATGYRPK
jgi:hypothetical protein